MNSKQLLAILVLATAILYAQTILAQIPQYLTQTRRFWQR